MTQLPDVRRYSQLGPEWNDPTGESLIHSQKALKVWQADRLIAVLGNSQKPEIELNLEAINSDKIPVLKRHGGGGTVLLSPKGFCMGFRFKKSEKLSIHDYFEMGTGCLAGVLHEEFGLMSAPRGISDLCIGQKKILGCSMYMPKGKALYLASILLDDDAAAIARYLAHPSREPDYREGRKHEDFITKLSHHLPHIPTINWWQEKIEAYAMKHLSEYLDIHSS